MKIIARWIILVSCLMLSSCDRGRQPIFDISLEGKAAPNFSLPLLSDDSPLKLSDYRGKLVLLNFWASWCPPCLQELPTFMKMQAKYGGDKFTILGVATEDKDTLLPFVLANKVNYPVTHNLELASKVAAAYGDPDGALPYSVLISPDQTILKIYTGIIKAEQFEAMLDKHL